MGLFGKSNKEKGLELQISAVLDQLKRREKELNSWRNKFLFLHEEYKKRSDEIEDVVKFANEATDLLNGLKVYKFGKGKKRANTSTSSKHAQLIESWQKKNKSES